MQINLNNRNEFTRENVAKLIGSVVDTQHWQLRVRVDGTAYMSDILGNRELDGLAFRLETWCAGNNYVGFQAEHDKEWVDRVFQVLMKNWPTPTSSYIDYY